MAHDRAMHSPPAGAGTLVSGNQSRHDLALGCFASICRDRLAEKLLAFSQRCPSADICLHEMSRGALLPALKTGAISLAVLPGGEEPGISSIEIWQDRVMLACPPGHRLAERPIVAAAELVGETFLVSRQQYGGDMHRFLAQQVLPHGPVLNATILDLGPAQIVNRVAQGAGVTLVCESHLAYVDAPVVVRPILAEGAVFPVRAYWNGAEAKWPLSSFVYGLGAGA